MVLWNSSGSGDELEQRLVGRIATRAGRRRRVGGELVVSVIAGCHGSWKVLLCVNESLGKCCCVSMRILGEVMRAKVSLPSACSVPLNHQPQKPESSFLGSIA